MPSCPATRRASSAASSEQQLFLNSEYESATSCRRIQTPTVSAPDSASNAAATDESTPPDIATRTLPLLGTDLLSKWVERECLICTAQARNHLRDDRDCLVDLGCSRGATQGESERSARLVLRVA